MEAIVIRNKKLLVAPGITTSSKKLLGGGQYYYYSNKKLLVTFSAFSAIKQVGGHGTAEDMFHEARRSGAESLHPCLPLSNPWKCQTQQTLKATKQARTSRTGLLLQRREDGVVEVIARRTKDAPRGAPGCTTRNKDATRLEAIASRLVHDISLPWYRAVTGPWFRLFRTSFVHPGQFRKVDQLPRRTHVPMCCWSFFRASTRSFVSHEEIECACDMRRLCRGSILPILRQTETLGGAYGHSLDTQRLKLN